jgi:hypothetical protein
MRVKWLMGPSMAPNISMRSESSDLRRAHCASLSMMFLTSAWRWLGEADMVSSGQFGGLCVLRCRIMPATRHSLISKKGLSLNMVMAPSHV